MNRTDAKKTAEAILEKLAGLEDRVGRQEAKAVAPALQRAPFATRIELEHKDGTKLCIPKGELIELNDQWVALFGPAGHFVFQRAQLERLTTKKVDVAAAKVDNIEK